MHLVLFGATGLVGSSALQAMIRRPDVTKVTCISRKPVPMADGHSKVEIAIHDDFMTYDEPLLSKIKGATGVVWALGTSQNSVSKDISYGVSNVKHYSVYVKITRDYTLAAAQAFAKQAAAEPAGSNFVFVSGEGATHSPGMLTPIFGRCKGETELKLLDLAQASQSRMRTYVVRPGGVDPSQQPEILPFLPKMEVYKTPLLAVMRIVMKGMHSPTKPLGEFLVALAAGDKGGAALQGEGVENDGWVVTNRGFRAQMGLAGTRQRRLGKTVFRKAISLQYNVSSDQIIVNCQIAAEGGAVVKDKPCDLQS
ncbi:hypothetical protein FH972_021662 [Carpinus fangiana]|uniref:NAD(P)-binding domain-containing protein n=1 Tax=Carpinus fangiana TaxID=176857 RepID=A0A5N6KQB9_9ROSI|nr:hypothetical protein FH972_021662 [Carpinus fangiana]